MGPPSLPSQMWQKIHLVFSHLSSVAFLDMCVAIALGWMLTLGGA